MKKIEKKLPLIVLFGRTNVGKSTLFNCLIEKKQAITADIEGTTRDSNINIVEWGGKKFELVDTGGIMDLKYLTEKKLKTDDIEARVQKQARDFLSEADLILFLVDSRTGLLPQDRQMATVIKKNPKLTKKTLVIANKSDNMKLRTESAEFNKLGLGEPIPVSAANGSGTGDMLDIVIEKIKSPKKQAREKSQSKTEEKKPTINICIIGKPNVGKSSLLNSILGYERVIVSDVAHTTREPQDTDILYKDNELKLIDTAGISKKGTKTKGLQKFGIEKSLKALKNSDIALLVIDVNEKITHQDLKLIQEITDRKASFIIVANKWDLIKEKNTKEFSDYIYGKMPFAKYVPIQFTSALTKSKVNKILDLILKIKEQREKKIGDTQLDRFIKKLVKIHKPPKAKGTKRPRIYDLKQVHVDPPKFEVKIGAKDTLDNSYLRFIENRLREKYGFIGTPITVYVNQNPKIHGKHEEK